MEISSPVSQTALMAAAARAAHLLVDGTPTIFADTLAEKLLGDRAGELLAYHRLHGDHPILANARAQTTIRGRYTEERVAERAKAGVGQYVILGAGLDTYAYREPAAELTVFEVDHPATQAWKRQRLADARIDVPASLRFVPVDFESAQFTPGLVGNGFALASPAIVSWLGVTMYLGPAAIAATLDAIGGFAPGSELILDYLLSPALRDVEGQRYAEQVGAASAEGGEPWRSVFTPDELSTLLAEHGLEILEQVRAGEALPASCWQRTDALRPAGLAAMARAVVHGR